jgi:hypothetical protein
MSTPVPVFTFEEFLTIYLALRTEERQLVDDGSYVGAQSDALARCREVQDKVVEALRHAPREVAL